MKLIKFVKDIFMLQIIKKNVHKKSNYRKSRKTRKYI